jgi:hypothetical protein
MHRYGGATASPFACVMAQPEVGLVLDGAPRTGLFVCGHVSQYAL